MRNYQLGKILFPFLIILLVVTCIYLYLPKHSDANQTFANKPVIVSAVNVTMQTQSIDLESLGTSRANEAIFIKSAQNDYVTEVFFNDGDIVKKGQVLVQLNSEQEKSAVAELQINLKEEQRQLNRLTELAKSQATAKSLLEEQRSKFEATQVQLASATIKLAEMTITAPFSGRLGQRLISPGAFITSANEITTLDDISTIKVDFNVPEKYLAALKPNMVVTAKSPAYPDITFSGVLSNISSRINPATRSVPVTASFDNKNQQLRSGMLLHTFVKLSEFNAILVPEIAIIPIENQHFVYVVENGLANRKEVTILQRLHGQVAIAQGLSEGQQVVTEGIIKIRPGSSVEVKGDAQ
jgi:membrane fusion protein (multidrug efflux system)